MYGGFSTTLTNFPILPTSTGCPAIEFNSDTNHLGVSGVLQMLVACKGSPEYPHFCQI